MKKKVSKFLLLGFLMVLMLLVLYFLLANYYRQGFSLNTWINGVYCTGKSVEEVNSELLEQVKAPIVTMTDRDGQQYEIDLSQADYQAEYLSVLNSYMAAQNPYLWIDNVTFHRNHDLLPQISYDEAKLRTLFEALLPVKKELETPKSFDLRYSQEKGYYLENLLSNRLDTEKAFQELLAAIDNGENCIDLAQLDCYYEVPLTAEQEELLALWKKIDAFQQCNLVYDMGEDESLDKLRFTPAVMAEFLVAEKGVPVPDEKGNLVLNEEAVTSFVSRLADTYDTYGKEREFQSTRGDVIMLTKGTYGTTLNQKAEVKFLMEMLTEKLADATLHTGEDQLHIPTYKREAFVRGVDDLGDTYIEIDMTEQKLYYYKEGEQVIATDVVTGNLRRKMGTPSGIYYVYNKQTDRVLRGPGYASPVDYWMPVKGGIGIHDADWRKDFGGEIYKKNGSHGCINVPPKVMPELYEMVEIGTPVVMFY